MELLTGTRIIKLWVLSPKSHLLLHTILLTRNSTGAAVTRATTSRSASGQSPDLTVRHESDRGLTFQTLISGDAQREVVGRVGWWWDTLGEHTSI